MKLMTKSSLVLEPAAVVALDATGELYRTPTEWQIKPGGIAAFEGVLAELRVKVTQTTTPAAGAVSISVISGTVVLGTVAVDLTAGATISKRLPLSGNALETGVPLDLVITGDTAADAGVTATVSAVIDLETPLMLTGC